MADEGMTEAMNQTNQFLCLCHAPVNSTLPINLISMRFNACKS